MAGTPGFSMHLLICYRVAIMIFPLIFE